MAGLFDKEGVCYGRNGIVPKGLSGGKVVFHRSFESSKATDTDRLRAAVGTHTQEISRLEGGVASEVWPDMVGLVVLAGLADA